MPYLPNEVDGKIEVKPLFICAVTKSSMKAFIKLLQDEYEEDVRTDKEQLIREWQELAHSIFALQDLPDEEKHKWMQRSRLEELDEKTESILRNK